MAKSPDLYLIQRKPLAPNLAFRKIVNWKSFISKPRLLVLRHLKDSSTGSIQESIQVLVYHACGKQYP